MENLIRQPIKLNLVVAIGNKTRGIGLNGKIPWRIPKDLKFFSKITTGVKDVNKRNAVIMGRLTWFSIPKEHRPLPNRLNVIISSNLKRENSDVSEMTNSDDIIICSSFKEAINLLTSKYADKIENIYSIGGSRIYKESLEYPSGFLNKIYLTRVFSDVECDTFMEPENFLESFKKLEEISEEDKKISGVDFNTEQVEPSNKIKYTFEIYEKS